MRLLQALKELAGAVTNVLDAAKADDKTPLRNAMALAEAAYSFGADPQSPDVVVFGDLNRFKALNDDHGHAAGDAMITHVGKLIQTLIVEGLGARGFRKSGDEFVILCKESELELFRAHLSSFSNCTVMFNGNSLRASASFGAVSSADANGDFQALLDLAEAACRSAKAEGDGVLVRWSPQLMRSGRVSLRTRCRRCDTVVVCEVPSQLEHTGIARCPICGEEPVV